MPFHSLGEKGARQWNSGLGRALCQGHGEEGLASFPEEMVCEPRLKDCRSYWQRLRLELAGTMEPNVQSQETGKSQRGEVGALDGPQGQEDAGGPESIGDLPFSPGLGRKPCGVLGRRGEKGMTAGEL